MKFLETEETESAAGMPTFTLIIGKSEILLLSDVLHYLHRVVPNSFFTQPFTSRANAMRVELDKLIEHKKLREGRKRPKGFDLKFPNETF